MSRTVALGLTAVLSLATLGGCRAVQPPTAAAAGSTDPGAFTGTVAETMNGGGYTYVRLQADGSPDVWAAATAFPAQVGDRLTVALDMPMKDFESKALNRTFPLLYFVASVTRDGEVVGGAAGDAAAMSPMTSHPPVETPATVEPVAPAPGGLSVADVWAQRTALAGKTVTVRGKVVKVNNQIMGTNWVHLQDGSGSPADRTNDLTITTSAQVAVGDIVTVTGVLAVGKDIGSGYAFDVLVEGATVVE